MRGLVVPYSKSMQSTLSRPQPAFTLLELLVVIAILVLLTGLAQVSISASPGDERRMACDQLIAMLERARTIAVVRRSPVVLGLDLPDGSNQPGAVARVALFQIDAWPCEGDEALPAVMLTRWLLMGRGVVFHAGAVEGMGNPIDEAPWRLKPEHGGAEGISVKVLVFDETGRLVYPEGALPVVLRLTEGRFVGGRAVVMERGGPGLVAEDWVSVGRHSGRPHWISR